MKAIVTFAVLVISAIAPVEAAASDDSPNAKPVTTVSLSICARNYDCMDAVKRYCSKEAEYESSPSAEVFHKARLAYFLSLAGIVTAPSPGFEVQCSEP